MDTAAKAFSAKPINAEPDAITGRHLFLREIWTSLASIIGLPDAADGSDQLQEKLNQKLDNKDISTDMIAHAICQYQEMRQLVQAYIVRELSKKEWGDSGKPPPQIGAELVAHLLKHGFVDHVINFNFDEVLDEALACELDRREYETIQSDHAILGQSYKGSSRRRPRHIKIHGSVTAQTTLRFRPADTGVLSHRMIDILDETLLPAKGEVRRRVVLISLGYAWNDADFSKWVTSRLGKNVDNELWVVRSGNTDPGVKDVKTEHLATKSLESRSGQEVSLDSLLWVLWEQVCDRLDSTHPGETAPTPASRHLLLSFLLGYRLTQDGRSELSEFVSSDWRLKGELLLHCIKSKGLVSLSAMANDFRIMRYAERPAFPLEDRLIEFGAAGSEVSDVAETFILAPPRSAEGSVNDEMWAKHWSKTIQHSFRGTADEPGPSSARPDSNSRLSSLPSEIWYPVLDEQGRIRIDSKSTEAFLEGELTKIHRAPEVEVRSRTDPRLNVLFSSSQKPIRTHRELKRETDALLGREWTHLLAISETGEWLVPQVFKGEVLLIRARVGDDWPQTRDVQGRLENSLSTHGQSLFLAEVDWWTHNRHMTLAWNEQEQSGGCIFFRRRIRIPRISPVLVTARADLIACFRTFYAYAIRAANQLLLRLNQEEVSEASRLGDDARRLIGLLTQCEAVGFDIPRASFKTEIRKAIEGLEECIAVRE